MRVPRVTISLHVDDISCTIGGVDQEDVLMQAEEVVQTAIEELEGKNGMAIAGNKTFVLGTDHDIVCELHRRLGEYGGEAVGEVRRLGLDYRLSIQGRVQGEGQRRNQG